MQKCRSCGADLPENTRFCIWCGSMQNALAPDAAVPESTTPQPQSGALEGGTPPTTRSPYNYDPVQDSMPTWTPNVQELPTQATENDDDDEQRRGIAPWSLLSGTVLGGETLLGSGQASAPSAPVVQGTPQIGSAPSVAGSPTFGTNAPTSPPAQGPAHAPAYPAQASGNTHINHPTQASGNTHINHSTQASGNTHINHPMQGPAQASTPQPTHHLPEQPGTQEQHLIHTHHQHLNHPAEYEPHRPSTHPARQEPHRAARVAKASGGSSVKTLILVVTAVVVVAAGGIAAAAHFLARPQPLISITSQYKVGNTPAGASGTSLHMSGQNFSSDAPVTFLLDDHAAPGNSGTRSDSNGTFSADVTITDAWRVGTHTLTARDASNGTPKNSVSVTIVQPGQANTPGPNGAPPDDASFRLNITVQVANPDIADPFALNPVLLITGHPDPEGGTVCSPDDTGQSFTRNSPGYEGGTPYTQVTTASCSGTYKAGQISYVETNTSAQGSFQSNGSTSTCTLNSPTVDLHLTGTFTGNNTFSGTFNVPYIPYTCDQQGSSFWQVAGQGTWTGTMVTQ